MSTEHNQPSTREVISLAARQIFARSGYAKATIRAIAGEAGVDVALVMHYFGSKQSLFVEVMRPLVEQQLDTRLKLFAGASVDDLAEIWVTLFSQALQDAAFRELLLGVLRAAASEPAAVEMVKQVLIERVMRLLSGIMPPEEARLRATFVGSTMVGVMTVRYIIGVEPLNELEPDRIARYIRPAIQHYLTMPL